MSEPRLHSGLPEKRHESPWWGIHEARYRFACKYVEGDTLLDVACGTGYGIPIVSNAVPYTVGIDIDHGALQSARAEIKGINSSLIRADGCILPFGDGVFNSIVSFETIEHLDDAPRFVSELARVLAPGGVCLISTPNANYTLPQNAKPRNPYHVREYTPREFAELLRCYFRSVDLIAQRLSPVFGISPFWDDQQKLRKPVEVFRLIVWRILKRAPRRTRDPLSHAILGQPLIPSASDYEFVRSVDGDGPTQLAVCTNLRQ